jgi:hypothetical protein
MAYLPEGTAIKKRRDSQIEVDPEDARFIDLS